MQTKNKLALITGASSGIGLELAKLFAADAYDLILVSRNIDKVKNVFEEFEINVSYISKDLSNIDEVKDLYCEIRDLEIDTLINNAGFGDSGELVDLNPDTQIKMINLNISALTYLSQMIGKDMKAQGYGKILNIASVAGFLPGTLMATYYSTKAYVLNFSYALAEELDAYGVQVSVACPGSTHTDFGDKAGVDNLLAFQYATSVDKVAKEIYKGLFKGKRLIITGLKNKLLVNLIRLLPRSLNAKINKAILSK